MNKYIINEETLKAVLNYLVSRPYQEVYQGIEALQKLEKFKETELLQGEKDDKKDI